MVLEVPAGAHQEHQEQPQSARRLWRRLLGSLESSDLQKSIKGLNKGGKDARHAQGGVTADGQADPRRQAQI